MAETFTHTQVLTYTSPEGPMPLLTGRAFTAGHSLGLSDVVAATNSAVLFNVAFTYLNLKSLCIISDQDVSLLTNSSSAPDETINLKASNPLVWDANSYYTNKFGHDVTKLYFINNSGVIANVSMRILVDPTP